MQKLANKNIIITGATGGLGSRLAMALAREKANLTLVARNDKKLQEIADRCRLLDIEVLAIEGDVSCPITCKNLIEESYQHFGSIDIIINNAGLRMAQTFESFESVNFFQDMMDTNYLGPVYCTYYALPHLKKSSGQIVAISSVQGIFGAPARTLYSASKHAIQGFFNSLRLEIGKDVNILTVLPTWINYDNCTKSGFFSTQVCADEVVKKTIDAIKKRKKTVIIAGIVRYLMLIRKFFPNLADKIVMKAMSKAK